MNRLPKLGVGLTWRFPQHQAILDHLREVDWVELIAEQFVTQSDEKWQLARELAAHLPVSTHGVSLSIGTADLPLDGQLIEKTIELNDQLQAPWFSEHLCFTKVPGIDLGQLTPVPFTEEQVSVVVGHAKEIQALTKRPFLLENITYYFQPPGSVMQEHEFISQVVEQADIGLLLDVTNVYTNSVNHGYDPYEFILKLPRERIVELHVAGGEHQGDLLMDTHSQPVPSEVWDLVDFACKHASVQGIILERDSNQPSFDELVNELRIAREIWRRYQ